MGIFREVSQYLLKMWYAPYPRYDEDGYRIFHLQGKLSNILGDDRLSVSNGVAFLYGTAVAE
jgi:hypothetical protein